MNKRENMSHIHCKTADIARAILIALMILAHIVHFGELYPDVKFGILAFIMPSFLILTGALVNVEKSLREFGLYLLRIFLPYLVMVLAFGIASLWLPVADGLRELSLEAVARMVFVDSIGPYWFLHAMIVCGAAYYAVWHLGSRLSAVSRLMVLGAVLLALGELTPIVKTNIAFYYLEAVARMVFVDSIGPYWFLHAMIVCGAAYYAVWHLGSRLSAVSRLMVLGGVLLALGELTPIVKTNIAFYYLVGVAVRQFAGGVGRAFVPSLWAFVPFGLLLFCGEWDWGLWRVLAMAFCFMCGVAALTELLHGRLSACMEFIGRNTLPIYLFHPIFTMAAKFYLPAFAFDGSGVLHAAVTVAFAIGGSLGLAWLMERTRASYLFGRRTLLR